MKDFHVEQAAFITLGDYLSGYGLATSIAAAGVASSRLAVFPQGISCHQDKTCKGDYSSPTLTQILRVKSSIKAPRWLVEVRNCKHSTKIRVDVVLNLESTVLQFVRFLRTDQVVCSPQAAAQFPS
ncbi:hypothetical protein PoB_000782900 [Plakobranchus ocellatus]|uniref:Uncharacterized protein n=1 Tax=Plakobranchus ocellatus TaxID=259542 RepID=A0AAV3YH24_9GAST|nr:hypothetical protein PoB_000782900 [Plakobranchus ocellatus]